MIIITKLTNKVNIEDGIIAINDVDIIYKGLIIMVIQKLYTNTNFTNIDTDTINQFDKSILKIMIRIKCLDVYVNNITSEDINNTAIGNL